MHLQRWQVIEATSGSVIAGTAGWQIPAAGVNEFLEFSITSLFPVQPAMQGLVFLLRLALNRLAVPFSVTHGSCFPAIEDAVSAVQHWMGPGDLSCMHVRCCICLLVTQEPAVPAKPLLQVERLDSSAPGVDLLARLSARLADCLSISQCGLESMDEILDLLQQMTASWSAEEAAALEQFQQAASLDAALSAAGTGCAWQCQTAQQVVVPYNGTGGGSSPDCACSQQSILHELAGQHLVAAGAAGRGCASIPHGAGVGRQQ